MKQPISILPAIALRGTTILPDMIVHFDVSRERSMKAIEAAMLQDEKIFLVTQKDPEMETPGITDLYKVGTVAYIKQVVKLPHDLLRVLVEGVERAELIGLEQEEPFLMAETAGFEADGAHYAKSLREAMYRSIRELFQRYCIESGRISKDLAAKIMNIQNLEELISQVSVNIQITYQNQQKILEAVTLEEQYEVLAAILNNEIEVLQIGHDLQHKLKARVDKNQREYILREQPLFVVVTEALKKGWEVYVEAVTDSYTIAALMLTLKATVIAVVCNTVLGLCAAWAVTRFQFKGKKLLTTLIDVPVTVSPIIAGLIYLLIFGKQSILYPYLQKANVQIVFAVPGIVLATVFVTFPFVFRELLPVLESIGTDEEEAAALMGAKGWTIFSKITFPHIKWALLYGIVLCTARAMGEFGAVSVLSGHLRGLTNTLPLHVEILFNEFQYVPAFAVSSILVIMAVILLIIRSVMEHRGKKEGEV